MIDFLGSTTLPNVVVNEPTRNVRSGTEVYTIPQDTLPSYNDVVIEDLPTYEEIIRTKEEYSRSLEQR